MKQLSGIAVISLAVSACASHTGIVPMGQDTYMIAKQQATGFPGLGNMKAETIAEASRHCSGLGKEFQIVSTQETQPPYVLGNYRARRFSSCVWPPVTASCSARSYSRHQTPLSSCASRERKGFLGQRARPAAEARARPKSG